MIKQALFKLNRLCGKILPISKEEIQAVEKKVRIKHIYNDLYIEYNNL